MKAPRCERNLAGPEEDCGFRITYTPCGKPASWFIESRRSVGWQACEEHALEALRDGSDEVTDLDGEPMTLDDGEIARVAS